MDSVQDGVDVKTAAAQLGLSEEAIRKRIKRGTLDVQGGRRLSDWTSYPTASDTSSQPDNTQAQALQELVEARQQAAAAELRAAVAEEAVRRLEAERENHLQQISGLQVALDQQQRLHAALQHSLTLPPPQAKRQGLVARMKAMLGRDRHG